MRVAWATAFCLNAAAATLNLSLWALSDRVLSPSLFMGLVNFGLAVYVATQWTAQWKDS